MTIGQRFMRQYFGPSARYDRACVELAFPMDGEPRRLAPFEPVLVQHGLKLGEYLPDEPLPLDEAVCRLARAMLMTANLCLQTPWWSRHGTEGDRGWAAIAHPFPQAAAAALDWASGLLLADTGHAPNAGLADRLAGWLRTVMKTRVFILTAADALGIEALHLGEETQVYQLGQCRKGLHFEQASNERDAATGSYLDRNKHVTCSILRRLGLPATRGALATDADGVKRAVAEVGLPCVVKPLSLNQGTGVATFLRTEEQALAAFKHVQTLSQHPVLIENHVVGNDHRLMVSGDELLWVYRKDPSSVTGNGTETIGELIERENWRRATVRGESDAYLYRIATDEEFTRFLADRYGMTPATVLPAGESILVASQANIARGGVLTDVTGLVHPDNRTMAIRAARLIRTRTMGIDFVTPDISRSWREIPCAIVEVNRAPAVSGVGDSSLLVRTVFPNRRSGRVPSVVVIGRDAYCREAMQEATAALRRRGLRATRAAYAVPTNPNAPAAGVTPLAPIVETVLLDPEGEAALIASTPGLIDRHGFPLRRCDLLIVEDSAATEWVTAPADAVFRGKVTRAEIDAAIGKLAQLYADPTEGGAWPVLEPIAGDEQAFRLKVWRAAAIPRRRFWAKVGTAAPSDEGMITHEDLLAAVRALADGGRGTLAAAFAHDELIAPWFRVTFEASLPLPSQFREAARGALMAATQRVNAIVADKL